MASVWTLPLIGLLALPIVGFGNECIQDTSLAPLGRESNMPRYIGSKKADAMRPFPALCDTMYVSEGDTSTIYAGTLFHFSNPKFPSRQIIVHGYLQIQGSPSLSVSMAGSTTDTGLVLMAGGERWGGIKVAPTGRLDARHVLLTGADTVLDLRSNRVQLFAVRQKNCKVWIDSNRVLRALDAEGAISTVGTSGAKNQSDGEKSMWQRPATYWWGGGIVGVAAVGVVAYSLLSSDDGGTDVRPSSEFINTPEIPQDPK